MRKNGTQLERVETPKLKGGELLQWSGSYDHLRQYAELGTGQRGVGLIVQRPRLLPMSAIAKMSGHLLIAKGESVKELEKFIRKHRDPIVSACIQWLIMEVDKL